MRRRYQKLEENYDLCEAEWLHLPEEEQKNYLLIRYPGAIPCSPFEEDAEAEMEAVQREVQRKQEAERAAKEAAEEKARIEKEAEARVHSKKFIAQGYGILFQAGGEDREAAWDKAQKCFERALTWRPDAEQAAKGLAELRALRAAANGNGWGPDEEEEAEEREEREKPLRATITDFQMQNRDRETGHEIGAFVEYTVTVTGGGSSKMVLLRRFSSFKALHKALSASLPADVYPETVAIQQLFSFSLMTWFDTLDRDFIEQRAQWLRVYLSELIGSATLRQQAQVRSFLRLDDRETDSDRETERKTEGLREVAAVQQRGEDAVGQPEIGADRKGQGDTEEDDDEFERRLLEGTEPLRDTHRETQRETARAGGNGHSVDAGGQIGSAAKQRDTEANQSETAQRRLPANMPSTPRSTVGSGVYVCVCVCVCVCLSVCLSVCLTVCLSVSCSLVPSHFPPRRLLLVLALCGAHTL